MDEVLRRPGVKYTVDDFKRLQHDELSIPAGQLIAVLREARIKRSLTAAVAEARSTIRVEPTFVRTTVRRFVKFSMSATGTVRLRRVFRASLVSLAAATTTIC